LFPNDPSLLRLATAIISEVSDDWETGKVYLTLPNEFERKPEQQRKASGVPKGAAINPLGLRERQEQLRRSRSTFHS